jgi:hypothetical protein
MAPKFKNERLQQFNQRFPGDPNTDTHDDPDPAGTVTKRME